ncbi:cytochrome P450 family protein [Ceratobasidium sp. AG-Ba]|nr:cytochrome P450 family protein [Ceratobasidium sp. AG-Ba]QRW02503.1 cytochrome P450 family protein [Ceratobasidium sp. AG-Ba]
MIDSFTLASILIAASGLYVSRYLWRSHRAKSDALPLPPSPRHWPIIGNVLSMPTKDVHLGFIELGKQLESNIFWLETFGVKMVVLNSYEDATNLLERRSSIYSDRVCSAMVKEPSLTSAATLTSSIYGYSLESSNDPFVFDIKTATDNITKATMPSSMIVLVHLPEWFPGVTWKRQARVWREQKNLAVNKAYMWTKAQLDQGNDEGSIIASWLAQGSELGFDSKELEYHIKLQAASLFIGGAETTSKVVLTFVMAMLLFPEVQKRAQLEIDLVTSSSRLPTMEDRPKLEYVGRLVHEALRWCPVLPGGVPHASSQDDFYKGYHIPRGTIIYPNVWAMSRDPDIYRDPQLFNPDRFLDPNLPTPPAFGFGRRACPGLYYGHASLFIIIASILASFDILPIKDEHSKDVLPTFENTGHLTFDPKPFKVKFARRSQLHEELIKMSV